jgi:leader peptidase (prepilin peptidase)/N-methyltransferase
MIDSEAVEAIGTRADLRPNLAILIGGAAAVALVSGLSLPWPVAIASIVLGAFMIAGAEVDARTYLLPDTVTWGAAGFGIVAAPLLAALDSYPGDPWLAVASAAMAAFGSAAVLELLRWCYARIRRREGLGFGDVKLAAAVGAWLPLDAIPLCFGLAASAALVTAMVAHLRGERIEITMKLPFGAFLCPALWLVFYASALPR